MSFVIGAIVGAISAYYTSDGDPQAALIGAAAGAVGGGAAGGSGSSAAGGGVAGGGSGGGAGAAAGATVGTTQQAATVAASEGTQQTGQEASKQASQAATRRRLASATAALSAGSTVGGVFSAREQQRLQEELTEASRNKSAFEQSKARKDQVRQALIRRAEIENSAAVSGVRGSSSEAGALSSVQSQLGSNISDINSAGNTARLISSLASGQANAVGAQRTSQALQAGAAFAAQNQTALRSLFRV